MKEKLFCPRCKSELNIVRNTDWDSLVTSYYPLCPECGWTTKEQNDTEEQVVAYLEDVHR